MKFLTNQMSLEVDLLNDPSLTGLFCISTSYRQEPNPVEGRHDLVFPMFEFEAPGTFEDLKVLETDLVQYLGLADNFLQCFHHLFPVFRHVCDFAFV